MTAPLTLTVGLVVALVAMAAYSVGVAVGRERQQELHDRWAPVHRARWIRLGRQLEYVDQELTRRRRSRRRHPSVSSHPLAPYRPDADVIRFPSPPSTTRIPGA